MAFTLICVFGHTTFPPHYHHRDLRVTVAVWRKTPSLQLLVLTRFLSHFLSARVPFTLPRVLWHWCVLPRLPVSTCPPRTVVLVSPVTFAQSYLHKPQFQLPRGAPPPTTIEDRVCRGADVPPDADVDMAMCARGKHDHHGKGKTEV